MIYEHKVKAVVMLTKIFEEEPPVMKCWPYWNDRMPVHFDCLSLEVKSIQNYLFYEKRNIEIKYMVSNYNFKLKNYIFYLYSLYIYRKIALDLIIIFMLIGQINQFQLKLILYLK
jgi:hypothetical protein